MVVPQNPLIRLPAIYIEYYNSHHKIWGYKEFDNRDDLISWSEAEGLNLVHDAKQ